MVVQPCPQRRPQFAIRLCQHFEGVVVSHPRQRRSEGAQEMVASIDACIALRMRGPCPVGPASCDENGAADDRGAAVEAEASAPSSGGSSS